MSATIRFVRRSALVRWVSLAYAAVVLCASLYPLAGWRLPTEVQLWGRLAEWPRYYTWSDVLLNVAAYAPLGLLLTLWLRTRLQPIAAATVALLLAATLSSGMELLQAFVPPRVPSALDLFCNAVGALVGAWIALAAGEGWLRHDMLLRWRNRHLAPGGLADAGLALLGLWLLTQIDTTFWMFGTGDVRHLLPSFAMPYTAAGYMAFEAAVTALGLVTVFAIAGVVAPARATIVVAIVVLLALAFKSTATSWLPQPGRALLWVTPGTAIGLGIGVGGGMLLLRLPAGRRRAVSGFATLVAGMLLLNVAPDNPYLAANLQTARGGHLWSLGGATRIISMCWPVAAGWFFLTALRRFERSTP
ncbi:MAG: VanZ family protein [Burkholderiales bacterium]|nr:VanZ family protein [Burkholderiales bacterium]